MMALLTSTLFYLLAKYIMNKKKMLIKLVAKIIKRDVGVFWCIKVTSAYLTRYECHAFKTEGGSKTPWCLILFVKQTITLVEAKAEILSILIKNFKLAAGWNSHLVKSFFFFLWYILLKFI